MAKYLIINADDFGLNKEQNEAIKDLLKNKLITSTSLMAVASEAKAAVDFAEDIGFPVGVHITLNSDEEAYRYPPLTRANHSAKTIFGSKAVILPSELNEKMSELNLKLSTDI